MSQTKETLEEAAKKYSGIAYDRNDYEEKYINQQGCDKYDGFVEGAKWQAERMYSEEEVNLMFATLKANSVDNIATITNVDLFISSWQEQFKKK
jgi:hypothetical protein